MRAPELLDLFLSGPSFTPMLASSERWQHRAQWKRFLLELQESPPSSAVIAAKFHEQWHVCHHFLRELVDDDGSVLDALWVWLPRYEGSGLTLFRGENVDRFNHARTGWAWTPNKDTALMFARGLNAVEAGGVLLGADVDSSAIIAGPSAHSHRLGEVEFTVDPRRIGPVQVLEPFPPLF